MSFDPLKYQTVFVDESSQTKHRFLLLGSLIIFMEELGVLTDALAAARLPELPSGEIGWTKVSRTKLDAYRRFVDVFFDNPGGHRPFEFHSLCIDTHRLQDGIWNNGSREIGFNKEIFQLCSKMARLHTSRLIYVYLDSRQTKSSTDELRLILNRHRANKGDAREWPFRRVHFRNSAECQVMQLLDVLLGAVAYRLNGHDTMPGASPAKVTLSEHILSRANIRDVTRDTNVTGKFTIWHRRLR